MKIHFSLLLVLLVAPVLAAANQWPVVEHPPGTHVEGIGESVRLNGIPMRMTRVVSTEPLDAIAAHYREALGGRVAVSDIESSRVLSQARGDYFITVTIHSLGGGFVEALVSIADVPGARDAANRPLGFVLPADSDLLSDMESVDAATSSRQLVVMNSHGLGTNLEHFTATLADRGLRPDGPMLVHSEEAVVQRFEGPTGEAKLVLIRRDGATSALLTLISNSL